MIKKKSGFTLAEVLITLAVIGVVAAVTLPSLMTGYHYNTLGVKLSKFMANLQAASRAYVAANDPITSGTQIAEFADSSFDFKSLGDVTTTNMGNFNELKDGTSLKFEESTNGQDTVKYPLRKYGAVVMNITFRPNISGLPTTVQHEYVFAVTESGYVYPASTDTCNVSLYQNLNYKTKASDFKEGKYGSSCVGTTATVNQ